MVIRQGGFHKCKKVRVAQIEITNELSRAANVTVPDRVWRGVITYFLAGNRWLYMIEMINLYARQVVGSSTSDLLDGDLVINALNNSWESRSQPGHVLFRTHCCNDGLSAGKAEKLLETMPRIS